MLCTMSVAGLYSNIPHDMGLSTVRKRLVEKEEKDVSTEAFVELAELGLKNNNFKFDGKSLKQKSLQQCLLWLKVFYLW